VPDVDGVITPLEGAILDFERACMKLVDEIETARDDRQPLREIYVRLHSGVDRLKATQEYLTRRMGLKGDIVTAAGGTLEPKWGKKRTKWHHDALKSIVSERILARHVDSETGVIEAPSTQLMLEMLDAVSFSSWKVTTLRKLGLTNEQIAEYCDEEPGTFNVVVRLPTHSPVSRSSDEGSN
jgi:hypothetical protein